jgi:photosystem II stability/assembly factor-like uncharacterized protein
MFSVLIATLCLQILFCSKGNRINRAEKQPPGIAKQNTSHIDKSVDRGLSPDSSAKSGAPDSLKPNCPWADADSSMRTDSSTKVIDSIAGRCIQMKSPNRFAKFEFDVIGKDLFARVGNEVFRSVDNGSHWTPIASGVPENAFREKDIILGKYRFRHNYQNDSSCPFTFLRSVIVRSSDGGKTWSHADTGLPLYCGYYVSAFSGFRGDLFVSLMYDPGEVPVSDGGVFRSRDLGKSWNRVKLDLPLHSFVKLFVATGPHMFAAILDTPDIYSATDGLHWTKDNSGLPSDVICNKAQIENAYFVIGTDGRKYRLFRSTDSGSTWTPLQPEMPPPCVGASLHAIGTNLFVHDSRRGAFISSDTGKSWSSISAGLPLASYHLNLIGSLGTTLFANADNFMGDYIHKAFRSTDNSASWQELDPQKEFENTTYFIKVINGSVFIGNNGGIFRSNDNGVSWEKVLQSPYQASLTAIGRTILAGTYKGVFRSDDNGITWILTSKDTTNPVTGLAALDTALFALQQKNHRRGRCNCVIRSTDKGESWTEVNSGFPQSFSVNALYSIGPNIFAATIDSGIYRYSLSCNRWVAARSEPFKSGINAVADSKTRLFIGCDAGLFMSTDSGTHWVRVKTDLPTNAKVVALAANDTDLLICTGFGLWNLPFANIGQ